MPICKRILDIIERPVLITIYGSSGTGKTTFALELLRYLCKPHCLYITTSGMSFLDRAQAMGINVSGLDVLNTVDYLDFTRVLTLKKLVNYDAIVFDSINQYASLDEKARMITLLVMAVLRFLTDTYGVYSIVTSQVIYNPRINKERPVLYNALKLWSDLFIELAVSDSVRKARIINPANNTVFFEATYTIGPEGMLWVNC